MSGYDGKSEQVLLWKLGLCKVLLDRMSSDPPTELEPLHDAVQIMYPHYKILFDRMAPRGFFDCFRRKIEYGVNYVYDYRYDNERKK